MSRQERTRSRVAQGVKSVPYSSNDISTLPRRKKVIPDLTRPLFRCVARYHFESPASLSDSSMAVLMCG